MSCPRSLKVFDTVASQVSALSFVDIFNFCVFLTFTICYTYQLFYVLVVLTRRAPKKVARANHRYAVMVAARNEETVIADLIHSIKVQNYPAELIDIFVIADNCTDNTADVAREAGAIVFPRSNDKLVGKGYALDYGLKAIWEQYADRDYEAFFVFDADNVLDVNYFREMNATFDNGAKASTSYRNSKNFGSNWISAGYGVWFLREAKFLNQARLTLNTSCAVSGTGFLFTRRILERCGGWRFFLLTEDIEFTIDNVTGGVKIGYCPDAITYDEQPVTFRQSWRQRMRWSRGYMQVFARYGGRLLRGMLRGSFSCYDMAMSIMPAAILTGLSIVVNIGAAIANLVSGGDWAVLGTAVWQTVAGLYLTLFAVGAITTLSEWKNIRCTAAKKVLYAFTFPLFMLTFVPICIAAVFKNPGWQPILHTRTLADLSQTHRRCTDTAKAANVTGM